MRTQTMAWLVAYGFLLAASAHLVVADTWMPPSVEVYYSSDKRLRLTVTPRDISNPLDYFEGLEKDEKQPGQRPGSAQTFARGLLERASGSAWSLVWDRQLVNDVAPVSALVSNSGSYVVTFDNWHFVGFGPNVVVIYGPQGKLVRSLTLEDILPAYYIKALPRSVSSIDWGGEHSISEQTDMLVLKIIVPSDERYGERRAYVELPVQLSTGHVGQSSDPSWPRASAEARRIAKEVEAAEAAADAAFRAPLIGPTTANTQDWHDYLREAFYRLDPDWENGFAPTNVLPAPGEEYYAPAERHLREALLEFREGSAVMIASPASSRNLLAVLKAIIQEMKPGGLGGVRVYVAVPLEEAHRFAAAFATTSATFIHLDPTKPIPQRPARLKLRFGER